MHLSIEHNLCPGHLQKALVELVKSEGLEEAVGEALAKALEPPPKRPRNPAMAGLFDEARRLYEEAAEWCVEYADGVVHRLAKARGVRRTPLTREEIQEIQDAIRERFAFLAAQVRSEEMPATLPELERWKRFGLVEKGVTPKTFAELIPGKRKIVRNAFVFGRLHRALEEGRNYEEVLDLALNAPLLGPDKHAVAVAEQGAAAHITGLGNDVAKAAAQQAIDKNRAAIRAMVVEFHTRKMPATVADVEAKEALGFAIPKQTVETWQGLAGELRQTFDDKARDWDRIAFTETRDAQAQGQAHALMQEYGTGQRVYKQPMPTACPQCKALYLREDGHPRTFELSEMVGYGSNVGRRPMPVRGGVVVSMSREDEAETLKPVAGQVHPWCECVGPEVVTGYEPWLED